MANLTPIDLLETAQKDLNRLSSNFNLLATLRSDKPQILWVGPYIPTGDWEEFKNSYLYFEDTLRKWLDSQRRLHKLDTSDWWLRVVSCNGYLRFEVCRI